MTASEVIEALADLVCLNSLEEGEDDDVDFFPGLHRVIGCGDKHLLILLFDDGSSVSITAREA